MPCGSLFYKGVLNLNPMIVIKHIHKASFREVSEHSTLLLIGDSGNIAQVIVLVFLSAAEVDVVDTVVDAVVDAVKTSHLEVLSPSYERKHSKCLFSGINFMLLALILRSIYLLSNLKNYSNLTHLNIRLWIRLLKLPNYQLPYVPNCQMMETDPFQSRQHRHLVDINIKNYLQINVFIIYLKGGLPKEIRNKLECGKYLRAWSPIFIIVLKSESTSSGCILLAIENKVSTFCFTIFMDSENSHEFILINPLYNFKRKKLENI
ncbi:hypothetical protein AGLY_003416 [Aphis glycines]|uniref:Uncharacterized protein n=1 Tax=Aphis glycines TaxID=307491 RepID=A0A6G0U0Z0_APHGL|nr:hypothetical protein AGLY_003416 [Aphis glycines]